MENLIVLVIPFMFIIPIFIVLSVVGIIGLFIYSSHREAYFEKGLKLVHKEKCGAWIDALNFTYPLVRISVYDEMIVIGYFKRIYFRYDEISEISIDQYYRVLKKGITIKHLKSNYPQRVIIWSFHTEKLFNLLNQKMLEKKATQSLC